MNSVVAVNGVDCSPDVIARRESAPAPDAVREAAERAETDLGNVLYNIETGELSAAWTEANEIRDRLRRALDARRRG